MYIRPGGPVRRPYSASKSPRLQIYAQVRTAVTEQCPCGPAEHPLRIDLSEPPTTAGTSAAIHLAGSVCVGVNSFSTAGINAALPPRTGIGVHLPTAGLSTAKSMPDSASAGDTVAVYDLAADNPDNPFAFNAICNALLG